MAATAYSLKFTALDAAEYAVMKVYVSNHAAEVVEYTLTWDDAALTLTLTWSGTRTAWV